MPALQPQKPHVLSPESPRIEEGLPGSLKSVLAPPALWVWADPPHPHPLPPQFTLLKNEINPVREIFVRHGENLQVKGKCGVSGHSLTLSDKHQPCFLLVLETGSHCVTEIGLKLVGSRDPPSRDYSVYHCTSSQLLLCLPLPLNSVIPGCPPGISNA